MNTIQQLLSRMHSADTLLCVGLDPDMRKLPQEILKQPLSDEEKVLAFLHGVVATTAQHVCAYKVQKAFFDLLPGGHEVLKEIIVDIHKRLPGVPVFVDCKAGDIDNTMEAYAANLFGNMGADGILVNPYMGDDVIDALAEHTDKAIVVLAKTSNPGGSIIQDVTLRSGRMLWEYILDQIIGPWNTHGNMIPVLAATAGLDMRVYRQQIPDQTPILLAGVGAQGGNTDNVRELLNEDGVGVFVNSSRGILYADTHASWRDSVAHAAMDLKTTLNKARGIE